MNDSAYPIPAISTYSRVFALEIQQTDLVIRGKENRSVELITPSGAHIERIYCCGALTEINRTGKTGWIIRVADPTGVFVLAIKARSPDLITILDSLSPPTFVSVTATVETDATNGEAGFRLVLETIHQSDRQSRDQWIIRTSHITLNRLKRIADLLAGLKPSEEEQKFMTRYGTSFRQLKVLSGVIERATSQVKVQVEKTVEADIESSTDNNASETVLQLIKQHSGPRGVSVQELTSFAQKENISETLLIDTIRVLIAEDELYQPSSGFIKIL
jgi:RPA family protein